MGFLFKAVFWLGLVFLILPDPNGAPAERNGASTSRPQASASAAIPSLNDATQQAVSLCRSHAEACASLAKMGASVVAEAATTAIRTSAMAGKPDARGEATDTLTPSDRLVPFGGVSAPVGEAPRAAPLPPRRPS